MPPTAWRNLSEETCRGVRFCRGRSWLWWRFGVVFRSFGRQTGCGIGRRSLLRGKRCRLWSLPGCGPCLLCSHRWRGGASIVGTRASLALFCRGDGGGAHSLRFPGLLGTADASWIRTTHLAGSSFASAFI